MEVLIGFVLLTVVVFVALRMRRQRPQQPPVDPEIRLRVERTHPDATEERFKRGPNRTSGNPPSKLWLSKEEADAELVRGADGALQVKVVPYGGELRFASTISGWHASKGNLALARLGIFYFGVRGTRYYATPSVEVAQEVGLRREPENEFDTNAIAIVDRSTGREYGHVNKGFARRLAKRLDAGESYVGISMRKGGDVVAIMLESVAVELDLWE